MSYTDADYASDRIMYSDAFKETYGCRPRHAIPDKDAMEVAMPKLIASTHIAMQYERQRMIGNQYEFHRRVVYVMETCNCNRLDAVRIAINHSAVRDMYGNHDGYYDAVDREAEIDFEEVCYNFDIPFGLQEQLRYMYRGEL